MATNDIFKKCELEMKSKYRDVELCNMTPEDREEFLMRIAERGAAAALKRLGLSDEEAAKDIEDMRDLMRGYRVIKKGVVTTTLAAIGRVIGWAIVIAITSLVVGRSDAVKGVLKLFE